MREMRNRSFFEKRRGRAALYVTMATVFVIAAFAFVAVASDDSDAATLDSIEMVTPPTKTVYNKGESLDLAGMKVKAIYSDSSEAEVTNYTTTPAKGSVLNTVSTWTIKIAYSEGGVDMETTFNVTVNPAVLESINVTTMPTKTVYVVGNTLSFTGMIVTAKYSDGSNKYPTSYKTSPESGAILNAVGTQTVKITYEEGGITKETALDVAVIASALSSISVTTLPKIEYTTGEKLNLTGLVVTAKYANGTTEIARGYTTTPAKDTVLNTAGKQTVTIAYALDTTKTTTFNITVSSPLSSINVTTEPTKKVYAKGESLNLSGLVVTAKYSDNSTKAVTGYTTSPASGDTLSTIGTQKVTVTYKDGSGTRTTSFSVTVNAPLSSISITTQPAKVEYAIGDTLNLNGMVVTAKYSNNASSAVTQFTSSPAVGTAFESVGTETVTISYKEEIGRAHV
jgi:hypothetical protein